MRDKGMTMKKNYNIIMIALILLGLVTPALAQNRQITQCFPLNMRLLSGNHGKSHSMKRTPLPGGVASMTKNLTQPTWSVKQLIRENYLGH